MTNIKPAKIAILSTDRREERGRQVGRQRGRADQALITSRNPGDLDAFCAKIVEEVEEDVTSAAPPDIRCGLPSETPVGMHRFSRRPMTANARDRALRPGK